MNKIFEVMNFGLALQGESELRLVSSVSLNVHAGETIGLVGESGSGKSLTLRAALRLFPKGSITTGTIKFAGEDILTMSPKRLTEVRRSGVSMIFQNPKASLDPVKTIGHFLTETLCRHQGIKKGAAKARAIAALKEVGISHAEHRIDQYPHELSGGMLQRVMICATLLSGSKLLLADEPTTALDVTTQAEVIKLLNELRRKHNIGMVFVTHDLELASAICGRIYVMYAGRVVEELLAEDLADGAIHPYTRALLAARPSLDYKSDRLEAITGKPLGASEIERGCAFASRCTYSTPKCFLDDPDLVDCGEGHRVLCFYAKDFTCGTRVKCTCAH